MPENSSRSLRQGRCCEVFKCYISAIVLGMNDALVELTGALAGFTIALGNNRLIAMAGITTGVAATLSMAAAEFLSQEAAKDSKKSWDAAFFTGIAYLITVAILLTPFFICAKPLPALALSLCFAALIILGFTWVTSRINNISFVRSFLRMLSISFSVAAIAFGISWCARLWWGIEI